MQSKPLVTDLQNPELLGINEDSTGWKRIPEAILLPLRRIMLDSSKEMGGVELFTYTM